jgi:hypothetical protein
MLPKDRTTNQTRWNTPSTLGKIESLHLVRPRRQAIVLAATNLAIGFASSVKEARFQIARRFRNRLLLRLGDFGLTASRSLTAQVKLHHSNFTAGAKLQVGDIEHWRALDRPRSGQLHGHLFGG